MEAVKKVEKYSNLIKGIKYENENGGAYAYLQFLYYNREILILLRSVKRFERQAESIEAINWLLNEYLAVNFTYRHKLIFDEKINEVLKIFSFMSSVFYDLEKRELKQHKVIHAQAA